MGDDVRPQAVMSNDPKLTRTLHQIAASIGVPVTDFHGPSILDQEAQTLITLIQSYLVRVDPDSRERFMRAVLTLDV